MATQAKRCNRCSKQWSARRYRCPRCGGELEIVTIDEVVVTHDSSSKEPSQGDPGDEQTERLPRGGYF